MENDDAESIFDISIAAYLLNPLQNTYDYDDIAREYLDGALLPTRTDLLGKDSLKAAWEKSSDGLMSYACHQMKYLKTY